MQAKRLMNWSTELRLKRHRAHVTGVDDFEEHQMRWSSVIGKRSAGKWGKCLSEEHKRTLIFFHMWIEGKIERTFITKGPNGTAWRHYNRSYLEKNLSMR
ncbi:hypothetical protein ECG_04811 [Echinococcus granulosus]|nr:hypothetical protein ECG_04811 [Echinococcus granulosus]